ncbi:coiled-coil domain-containing protein 78 isoform X1 [Myiozetetes cayanensis]|uniref:coiled-coil domain-containing protein 78 isoform X1 n=1 Tax=Myiozetetes cayanensis TaxID=478635 RepID=UPI00215E1DC1|nr:coiled-coil domain-containing protein 78 isoform X1 [Myiozetetes cayanensis]
MDLGIVAGNEKVQLQDGNDGMDRLGDPQEGMRQVAGSKADFPAGVLFSEEEKLKISKDLVDLQIETNKMKEQYETENFELKNMVLALESRVRELELCSEEVTGERDSLRERLRALESARKELAQEYIILKSNYLALGKELDQEVRRNEELTQELLKLARGKNSLPGTESTRPPAMAHQSSVELERERGKPEDVVASEPERQELERNLLGNQDHIKVELEKLKKTHDWQQQKLEERVLGLGKELQEAKGAIGDTQRRLVEQSAVLLTSQSQLQEVEAENSQLQLRLKELNEEYRSRLARYIRDVANYMDSKSSHVTGHSKAPADHAAMRHFVDNMLKDIRASYKSREEQLARAARGYKKRMKDLVKKHQNLLIAYGLQREQIRSLGSGAVDCGPAELHFCISDPELLTNSSRELNRLQEEKARLEMQLQELQKAAGRGGLGRGPEAAPGIGTHHPGKGGSGAGEEPAPDSGCHGRGAGAGAAGVHRSASCQVQAGDPAAQERRGQRGATCAQCQGSCCSPPAQSQGCQPRSIALHEEQHRRREGQDSKQEVCVLWTARQAPCPGWELRGKARGCSPSGVHSTKMTQDNCVSSFLAYPWAAGILLFPEHITDTGSGSQAAL